MLTAAFVQTVWGGGVGGNTPGSENGVLGVSSLSSAGHTGWFGQSYFYSPNTTLFVLDSGHPSTVASYSPFDPSGLSTAASFASACGDDTSVLKALISDLNGTHWLLDPGCGAIWWGHFGGGGSFSRYLNWTFVSAAHPASMALDSTHSFLYFTDTSAVYVMSAHWPFSTPVRIANTTAASNLSLSLDGRSLYFLDGASVKRIALPNNTVTTLAIGSALSLPSALCVAPDGVGLLVADVQAGNYSVIKYVSLTSVYPVSVLAPNPLKSNCGLNSSSYQSGDLSTACWGSIQQIALGSGVESQSVFFFEANTGRVKQLSWQSQLVSTWLGGGAPNNGFSNPNNTAHGWAQGVGAESAFESSMTAIIFNAAGQVGYVAEPVSETADSAQPLQPSSHCLAHSRHLWCCCCVRATACCAH